MNHRVIAFPCLMYITSIGARSGPSPLTLIILAKVIDAVMSIVTIFQDVPRDRILKSTISFNLVFCPVSLALTILLTLMIIVRLALHGRGMRNTMGFGTNTSKLYETLVTMFVESYALYTLSFIVNIAFVGVKNPLQSVFGPMVIGTQVRAVSHFQGATMTLRGCLAIVASRSSLRSSSFCELPIEGIRRVTMTLPVT